MESHAVEMRFYDGTTGPVRFLGQDRYGRPYPVISKYDVNQEALKEAMENLVRPAALIPFKSLPSPPIIEEVP